MWGLVLALWPLRIDLLKLVAVCSRICGKLEQAARLAPASPSTPRCYSRFCWEPPSGASQLPAEPPEEFSVMAFAGCLTSLLERLTVLEELPLKPFWYLGVIGFWLGGLRCVWGKLRSKKKGCWAQYQQIWQKFVPSFRPTGSKGISIKSGIVQNEWKKGGVNIKQPVDPSPEKSGTRASALSW